MTFQYYMWSLHLPGDVLDNLNVVTCAEDGVSVGNCAYEDKLNLPYRWVPGNDKPGDFREPGVAFQPIEAVKGLPESPTAGQESAWYFDLDAQTYSRWNGNAWESVPDGDVQRALDDKAYIDMPNFRFNTFLNPRRFTLGVRISF